MDFFFASRNEKLQNLLSQFSSSQSSLPIRKETNETFKNMFIILKGKGKGMPTQLKNANFSRIIQFLTVTIYFY